MRTLAVLLTAAVLVTSLGAYAEDAPEAVDVKAKIEAFQKSMKASRKDADARVRAVQELATVKHADVAAALAKVLKDRSPAVQAAVGRALGQQGLDKFRKALFRRVDPKKGIPEAQVGILEGLVGLPHASSLKVLTEYVKKVMYKEKEEWKAAGIAAVKAMGAIKDKKAIDELIGLIGMTNPRAGSGGAAISEKTTAFRGAFKQPILDGLANISGQKFRDPKVWQDWWADVGTKFKLPTGDEDLDAKDVYEDWGYKFRLKKPNKSWSFTRPNRGDYVIRLGHPQEGNEALNDVEIAIEAYSTSAYQGANPAARVAYYEIWARETGFKDVRETTNKDAKLAGENAKFWTVKGMASDGTVMRMEKYFLVHNNLLFSVHLKILSGSPEDAVADLRKALKSFKFMK